VETWHSREDDVKMDLKYTGWKLLGWINSVHDRGLRKAPVNTVMDFWVA
jgi:hypothetical protein